ncbi:uncharacterized protein SPSK_05694 [Sporothrix schenckii 1099-18]|uniref:Uncharacterized protein n=1 Tax=Sporothrix schenckii 1099-18 TaxID=1397361 RepID=A0A0F2LW83_SPOSC|nr:uncharacterized protein SPSK_05694 [Sporothrix schenckii 1099-18]KJR80755.1 hypothetical protein SPSK_05694 [Sporothrix schenckii 1099-18]
MPVNLQVSQPSADQQESRPLGQSSSTSAVASYHRSQRQGTASEAQVAAYRTYTLGVPTEVLLAWPFDTPPHPQQHAASASRSGSFPPTNASTSGFATLPLRPKHSSSKLNPKAKPFTFKRKP